MGPLLTTACLLAAAVIKLIMPDSKALPESRLSEGPSEAPHSAASLRTPPQYSMTGL